MSSMFYVKGRLIPYDDSLSEPVEFEVQTECFTGFVERLLSLGASIQSSGFKNIRNATALIDQAGWSFSDSLEVNDAGYHSPLH